MTETNMEITEQIDRKAIIESLYEQAREKETIDDGEGILTNDAAMLRAAAKLLAMEDPPNRVADIMLDSIGECLRQTAECYKQTIKDRSWHASEFARHEAHARTLSNLAKAYKDIMEFY